MPPRKRARSAAAAASDAPAGIVLEGGHAEKPRTIACYRDAKHCDVEVHASDGTASAVANHRRAETRVTRAAAAKTRTRHMSQPEKRRVAAQPAARDVSA